MFAVLQFMEPEKKIRSFFTSAKIASERITLPSGGVYFIVTAEKRRGKIPWKKLERCLGVLREGVILPNGVSIPDGVNISVFTPEKLPEIMLFNTAVRNIKSEGKIRGRLTVIDGKGLFIPYAQRIIRYFSEIKIITSFVEEYESVSALLFQKFGVSLLVTDEGKADGDVVISSDNNAVDITFSGALYTLEKRRLLSGRVLTASEPRFPLFIEKHCPEGVDRLVFASALYEKCGVAQAAEAEFDVVG